MKIAIIGAGGIGGYIGGRLAQSGHEVTLVARGAHMQAIQENGLKIKSPHGDAHVEEARVTNDIESIGPVDVIFAAVKLPDLEAAARSFPALVHPGTRVVTTQNGIDAKSIIGAHVDPDIVAQGIIYLAAYIEEPGVVGTPGGKHLMVVDALNGDATMASFFDAVDAAHALDVTRAPDGDAIVWQKFTAQASIAGITALTRLPLGGVFASEEVEALLRQMLEEALAVAKAKGIALDPNHLEASLALYKQQPGSQSSSLLVDIEAGKPTELEWLSGRVHALGQELGVPTPAHSAAWLALAPFRNGPPLIRD